MHYIFRRQAKTRLGEAVLLHVRAAAVEGYAYPPVYRLEKRVRGWPLGGIWRLPVKAWSSLYAPPGDWDLQTTPFHHHRTFIEMQDLVSHGSDWRGSELYQAAIRRVREGHGFQYKSHTMRSVDDLDTFFNGYLLALFESMRTQGYLPGKAADNPGVMIGRDGRLIKSPRGRHRWAVASVLNVGGVVAEIECIHPLWLKQVEGGFEGASLVRLQQALAKLEVLYQ